MHRYRAYGLTLESELPFSGALPGGAEPDVRIGVSCSSQPYVDTGQNIRCVAATPTLVRLEWGGVGELLIEGGRTIVVRPFVGAQEDTLRLFVLGAGMGVLLHQRGLLVLHASSVCIDEKVVCFVGSKGAGKSTTAALFARSGSQLLSDELVVLKFDEEGHANLLPGIGMVKLWSDALRELGWKRQSAIRVRSGVEKFAVLVGHPQPEPRPLHRVYVLDYDDKQALSALSSSEAFLGLIPHLYVQRFGLKYIQATGAVAPVQALAKLVRCVPVNRLVRRRELDALPSIAKLVEHDLRPV